MGITSSSNSQQPGTIGAAGLESAIFQQRSEDKSGLQATRGVSVDDSSDGDFSDISYSEGGGIVSPKVGTRAHSYKNINAEVIY